MMSRLSGAASLRLFLGIGLDLDKIACAVCHVDLEIGSLPRDAKSERPRLGLMGSMLLIRP
ncbi:hypothetical protein HYPP_01583 [Hyphomicrobium sp. ghe19]|nr:hypothetical protein HYPP_01583 [Hyphomicrobium sp. ghe19]